MLGLSGEHIIILLGILLVFGPRRLPLLGSVLGKTVRNFKEHLNGITEPEFRRLPDQPDEDKKA